jgi:hypothetical protein
LKVDFENDLDGLYDKLAALEPNERLSALEGNLNTMVNNFRDRINKEALAKINRETQKTAPYVCKKGHSLSSQIKKKTFF